jgi:SNF family Na+-dependent transporter
MQPEVIDSELSFSNAFFFKAWIWTVRVVAPIAILAILISGLR